MIGRFAAPVLVVILTTVSFDPGWGQTPAEVDTTGAARTPQPAGMESRGSETDPTPPLPSRVRLNLSPAAEQADVDIPSIPFDPAFPAKNALDPHPWRHGDNRFNTWARYNRVEGLAMHMSVDRDLNRKDFFPGFTAAVGYAFAAKRGQYRLSLEQPLVPKNRFTLGASAYRSFLPFFYQDEVLDSGENSASAFFFHRDYWDWYEAEGIRGFLGFYPSPFLHLSVGILSQDETPLSNHADWSVFRQNKNFVVNPAIPEGQFRALDAALTFDSRPKNNDGSSIGRLRWSAVEHFYRVTWERGLPDLDGDFELWRMTADIRNYFRLSSRQKLAIRVLAGTGESKDGLLPHHRRYALGGLGTLRGHNYRELAGDNVALANLEYNFSVGSLGWALFFLDSGVAWDQGKLSDQHIPVDAGAGLRFGDDGLTILVARTVNRSDAEAKLYFRLKESF